MPLSLNLRCSIQVALALTVGLLLRSQIWDAKYMSENFISIAELARDYGVSRSTINRAVARGRLIPIEHAPDGPRFRPSDVDR